MLSCSKTGTGVVQNSWMTSMKGFDPIQMLTTVYFVYMLVCGERTGAVVLWLPSYHLSGCCTLVVVRRDSLIVKPFGCTVVHMKVLY